MKRKNRYWTKCGELFLVYTWSRKYNRFINTHAYTDKLNAELTVK